MEKAPPAGVGGPLEVPAAFVGLAVPPASAALPSEPGSSEVDELVTMPAERDTLSDTLSVPVANTLALRPFLQMS